MLGRRKGRRNGHQSGRRSGRRRVEDVRTMSRLIPAAEAAALADGQPRAGAEYLVLAALELPEDSARRSFEAAGADPDRFAEAVRAQHLSALGEIGVRAPDDEIDSNLPAAAEPSGPVKTSESAHQLFRRVVKLIRRERSRILGAYVVLAAAETDRGTVARALTEMGVDPAGLATAARAVVDEINSD